MPFGMGFGELVLILIIVVVVFGATKLPQLGDGLGKAIKNFKRAVNAQNEIDVSPERQGRARREPASSPSDRRRVRPPQPSDIARPASASRRRTARRRCVSALAPSARAVRRYGRSG